MNFFRSDDHQVALSQCWSLPFFTPFSVSEGATSPTADESAEDPLSRSSDTCVVPEVTTTSDTPVATEP